MPTTQQSRVKELTIEAPGSILFTLDPALPTLNSSFRVTAKQAGFEQIYTLLLASGINAVPVRVASQDEYRPDAPGTVDFIVAVFD